MNNLLTKNIDAASEYIMVLQSILRSLSSQTKFFELGLFQQFLDQESLYIKQIPRVRNIKK